MMNTRPRQPCKRLIRILSSEQCELFCGLFSEWVHEVAGEGISVATLIPATVLENDLLERAAEQRWDLAMLFLNNIMYSSNDRNAPAIIRDAGNLIRKMKQLFGRPILCFYGWPDDPEMIKVAIAAGAEGCFRVACSAEDVFPALRRCLDQVPGL
jgi:hypothetical protein